MGAGLALVRSQSKRYNVCLIASCLFFVAMTGWLAFQALQRTQGFFTYGLDDPYIHMAIAKNFSSGGVWGVDGSGFNSASSSPLWTLLLSLVYFFIGPTDVAPAVMNGLIGIFLIGFLFRTFAAQTGSPGAGLFVSVWAQVAMGMPVLVLCGQEHLLHALINLLFILYWSERIAGGGKPGTRGSAIGYGYAALMALIRYESMFAIAVVSAVLALRKRFDQAHALIFWGCLPIVIYGFISTDQGWSFFPNSVLIKAKGWPLWSIADIFKIPWAGVFINEIKENPQLMLTVAGAPVLILFCRGQGLQRGRADLIAVFFVVIVFFHMAFARTGWYDRYVAYLVTMGVVACGLLYFKAVHTAHDKVSGRKPGQVATALIFGLIFVLPTAYRGFSLMARFPQASANIYQQQVQMARFLNKYYQRQSVAANDVGAINYYAKIRCTDLFGLADKEVFDAKRNGIFGPLWMAQYCRQKNVKIAIIYDHWFNGIPGSWSRIGRWTIPDNVICGGDTVYFYAVDPDETKRLDECLDEFFPMLPSGVTYKRG